VNHEALAYRIDDARRMLGLGTTKLYALIGTGVLDARKAGSRTLITGESLRAYVANLPKANITTGREAA
jgi:hypothetical protein